MQTENKEPIAQGEEPAADQFHAGRLILFGVVMLAICVIAFVFMK